MTVKDLKKIIENYNDETEIRFLICFEDWDDPESTQDWYNLIHFDTEYSNDNNSILLDFAFKDSTTRKKMVKMLESYIDK